MLQRGTRVRPGQLSSSSSRATAKPGGQAGELVADPAKARARLYGPGSSTGLGSQADPTQPSEQADERD